MPDRESTSTTQIACRAEQPGWLRAAGPWAGHLRIGP